VITYWTKRASIKATFINLKESHASKRIGGRSYSFLWINVQIEITFIFTIIPINIYYFWKENSIENCIRPKIVYKSLHTFHLIYNFLTSSFKRYRMEWFSTKLLKARLLIMMGLVHKAVIQARHISFNIYKMLIKS
jgi:hypothetical protein